MANGWAPALLLGAVVLAGASVQRLAGIGFALIAVPALVLLLGPVEGVALANCGAGAISAIGLAGHWREVRLGSMLPLVASAACTVPVGVWVSARMSERALLVGTGGLVCVAVILVLRGARIPALRGAGGALVAGAVSGFMNSSAGVGGPAVSLYGVNAGWTAQQFVPNALFYGVLVNVFSIALKHTPPLSMRVWLLVALGIAGGAAIGKALAARLPERLARTIVLLLALAGGATTLLKGVLTG